MAISETVCFNTPPPEGGWKYGIIHEKSKISFNTQPPEGGWLRGEFKLLALTDVSTHSRPKAAG